LETRHQGFCSPKFAENNASTFFYIRNDASGHHRIQDDTTPADKIEQQGNDSSFHSHFSEYCSQSVHEHRESLVEHPALYHALHEKSIA
jgi:hypothetical protein